MVGLPAPTPVTVPEEEPIVAIAVLLLAQVPPAGRQVSVVFAPTQRVDTPVTLPEAGLTVTVIVVALLPQELVIV